jgi:hypothetical protein
MDKFGDGFDRGATNIPVYRGDLIRAQKLQHELALELDQKMSLRDLFHHVLDQVINQRAGTP